MSNEKIESRRAFMKKFGKLAGATAVAAPFIAMTVKEAVAKPDEDNPTTGCSDCSGNCGLVCSDGCAFNCGKKCEGCSGKCRSFVMFK